MRPYIRVQNHLGISNPIESRSSDNFCCGKAIHFTYYECVSVALFIRRDKKRMYHTVLGTALAQWLRCCATNRKVAGSTPACVSGFFIDIKCFRSHYGPGVDSASNRNEYQEYFLGGKGGRRVRLTTYHHLVPLSRNLGALTSWKPLGLSRPVMGLLHLNLYHTVSPSVACLVLTTCSTLSYKRLDF